jgi:hypothetical protein
MGGANGLERELLFWRVPGIVRRIRTKTPNAIVSQHRQRAVVAIGRNQIRVAIHIYVCGHNAMRPPTHIDCGIGARNFRRRSSLKS